MNEYHKIQSLFKRDREGRMLYGDYPTSALAYLSGLTWGFTEKVEGTNIRVMWDGDKIAFGGKTDAAQIHSGLVNKLNEMFPPAWCAKFLEMFGDAQVCLYGEGYGAKIQKGGGNYDPNGQNFVLFDVKIGDWWLERHNVLDVAEKLGLRTVPVVMRGTLEDMFNMCKQGFDSVWGQFKAEGLVGRPETELCERNGNRIITKLKLKDFDRMIFQK